MSTISRLARLNADLASPQSASTSAILGKLEALDNVLRLSLDRPAAAPVEVPSADAAAASAPAADDASSGPQPDFATAFDLLNRASAAMEILQNRCDELETSAKVRSDHFKMALDVAHQQIKASDERAAVFEAMYKESAALAASATQRAEAAETRARAAEQSASDSSEWLKCYYERIISAFGTRSESELSRPAG